LKYVMLKYVRALDPAVPTGSGRRTEGDWAAPDTTRRDIRFNESDRDEKMTTRDTLQSIPKVGLFDLLVEVDSRHRVDDGVRVK